jgi:hypothetical protein
VYIEEEEQQHPCCVNKTQTVVTPPRAPMPSRMEIKARLLERGRDEEEHGAVITNTDTTDTTNTNTCLTITTDHGFLVSPITPCRCGQLEQMVADRVAELRMEDKRLQSARRMQDAMLVKRTLEKKIEAVRKQDIQTMRLAVEKRLQQMRQQEQTNSANMVLHRLGEMMNLMHKEDMNKQQQQQQQQQQQIAVQNKKRRVEWN